jgi:hypothetical protein
MLDARSCDHCRKYFYDDDPQSPQYGLPRKMHNGTDKLRLRDHSCPPPCETKKGCPAGHHEKPVRLTPENREAYEHYQECKATGKFPDDPVVMRNAAIIAQAEQIHAETNQNQFRNVLLKAAILRG